MQPEDGTDGRSNLRIISVQPDRDHAFVEVLGECGHEGVAELRQRVDGLLIAGARFVLVDLTGGKGWLRVVGDEPSPSTARRLAAGPVHDVSRGRAERHGRASQR